MTDGKVKASLHNILRTTVLVPCSNVHILFFNTKNLYARNFIYGIKYFLKHEKEKYIGIIFYKR